jgi:hypothetical protein
LHCTAKRWSLPLVQSSLVYSAKAGRTAMNCLRRSWASMQPAVAVRRAAPARICHVQIEKVRHRTLHST